MKWTNQEQILILADKIQQLYQTFLKPYIF